MKLFKSVAIRAIALLLFFAMIAAVILYQAGVYDLSFIDRPLPPVTEEPTTTPAGESETEPPPPPPTTEDPFISETLPPTTEDQVKEMLEAIGALATLREQGYEISLDRFASGDLLARYENTFGAEGFSLRKETLKKTVLQQQSSGRFTTKTVNVTQDIPVIRMYFGLILVDNGKSYTVYNTKGEAIVKNFVGTLPMARSVNGHPVVMIGSKYYEIDPDQGLGGAIAKDQVDFKALSLDYTADYATGNSVGLYPFSAYIDIFTYVGDKPKPTEPTTEPEDSDPKETDPEETTEDTSVENTQPEDTSTEDTLPEDTTSEGTSAEDTAPEDTSKEDTSSEDTEPADTSADDTSAEDTSMEAPSTENTSSEESEPEETESEGTSAVTETEELSPSEAPANAEGEAARDALTPVNGTVEIDGKYYKVTQELRWGYRNAKGETVIEPQFKTAYAFTADGLAAVTDLEGNLFFINAAGKEVVTLRNKVYINPPEYNYVRYRQLYLDALQKDLDSIGMYYYDEGYVMVRYCLKGAVYKSENHLLDTKGNRFDVPSGYTLEGYSEGVLLLSKNGKFGYMDTDGGWISPAVYTAARPFQQGLAVAVDENGKYGMIDRKGELVLPYYFDYISQVSSGMIAAYSAEDGWQIYCVVSPT